MLMKFYLATIVFSSLLNAVETVESCGHLCGAEDPTDLYCFRLYPLSTYDQADAICKSNKCELPKAETLQFIRSFMCHSEWSLKDLWIGYRNPYISTTDHDISVLRVKWQNFIGTANAIKNFCNGSGPWLVGKEPDNQSSNEQCVFDSYDSGNPQTRCWSDVSCDNRWREGYCYCEKASQGCVDKFPQLSGKSSPNASFALGQSVTFTCDSFFKTASGQTVQNSICQSGNIWSLSKFLSCNEFCTQLDNATGSLEPSIYWVGSRYKFSCHEGYKLPINLLDQEYYTCLSQNKWDPIFQPCKRYCNDTLDKSTGSLESAMYWIDNSYKFTCRSGFKLPGNTRSQQYTCKINKQWEPFFTPCIEFCTNTFDSTNGLLATADYLIGRDYNYTCKDGYQLRGGTVIKGYSCSSNNAWNPVFEACKEFCTNETFDNSTGLLDVGDYFVETSASYNCNENFYIEERKQKSYFCNLNRSWSPEVVTCQEKREAELLDQWARWQSFETECCGTQQLRYQVVSQYPVNSNTTHKILPSMGLNLGKAILPMEDTNIYNPIEQVLSPTEKAVAKVVMPLGNSVKKFLLLVSSVMSVFSFRFDHFSLSISNCFALFTIFAAEVVREMMSFTNTPELCDSTAILLQFLYIWSFSFQLVKATELLAIYGNILSNQNYFHPYLSLFLPLIVPTILCISTISMSPNQLVGSHTCWLNLSSSLGLTTIAFGSTILWSSVVLVESASCVTFRPLRIRRCNFGREKLLLGSIFYWSHTEFILTLASWVIGTAAFHYQKLFLFLLAANLDVSMGVVTLFAQSGGIARLILLSHKCWGKLRHKSAAVAQLYTNHS